jgi:hypothetical protein
MESAEQGRNTNSFDVAQSDVFPAVLTCAAGVLGLVMVAAGPWLLLNPGDLWTVAQLAIQ